MLFLFIGTTIVSSSFYCCFAAIVPFQKRIVVVSFIVCVFYNCCSFWDKPLLSHFSDNCCSFPKEQLPFLFTEFHTCGYHYVKRKVFVPSRLNIFCSIPDWNFFVPSWLNIFYFILDWTFVVPFSIEHLYSILIEHFFFPFLIEHLLFHYWLNIFYSIPDRAFSDLFPIEHLLFFSDKPLPFLPIQSFIYLEICIEIDFEKAFILVMYYDFF